MDEALAAFGVSLALVLGLGPPTLRFLAEVKAGQKISTDAPKRHLEKQGTPTMGGLLILAGAVAGAGFLTDARGWVVLGAILGFGLLGFLDDLLSLRRGKNLGLKARHKLLGQVVLGCGFAWLWAVVSGIRPGAEGALQVLLSAFLAVVMSNAVNLTDGLDGLAGGLSLIAYSAVGVFAGSTSLAPVLFAVAGSCAGFLWYNRHPARVFMGDTGSLALGAGLAFGVMGTPAPLPGRVGLLLVVGVVFLAELMSVVIQVISFQTRGKRVFRMTPIHHHFELLGWTETQIVTRFWLAGALGGGAALLWALSTLAGAG